MENLIHFRYLDRSFEILEPPMIQISEDLEWIDIEIPELDIFCGGHTMDEAVEDFQEDIYFSWKTLVESDIDTLSEGAKQVRERFKEIVQVENRISAISEF